MSDRVRDETGAVRLSLDGSAQAPVIRVTAAAGPEAAAEAILAQAEALTAENTQVLRVGVETDPAVAERLLALGAARRIGAAVEILPGLLWQCAARWLSDPRPPFPELFTVTDGRRHPLRPGTPAGTVYARAIP